MDKFVVRSPKNSPTSSPRKNGIRNFRQSTLLSLKGVVIIEDIERAKIVLERSDTNVELKIDTLRHLKMKKPAKEILDKTGIGKTVYKLAKSKDKALATEAKDVYKLWKEHIEKIVGRPMLEVKCDLKTQNFRKSARQMILDGLKRDYSIEGGKLLNEERPVEENVGKKKSDEGRKDAGSNSEVDVTAERSRKEKEKDERKHEKDSKYKSKKKKSKSREREEDSKTDHTSKAVSRETVEINETDKDTKTHNRDLTEENKKDKRSRKEYDSIDIPLENVEKRQKEKDKETKKEDSEHVSKRKRSRDYKEHSDNKREKESRADAENVDKGERKKDKRKSEKHHRHKSERSEDSKKDKYDKDNSIEVLSENIERNNGKRKSEDAKHEPKKRKSETREKGDKSDKDCNSIEVLAEYIEREVYQNTKRLINKSYKRTIRKLVFCLRHQSDIRKAVASSSLSVNDFVRENLQE